MFLEELVKPEDLPKLRKDPDFSIHAALPWKGNPEAMPPGTARGLSFGIACSKLSTGVTGTAVDPKTGAVIPRHLLAQREIAKRLKELPEEERQEVIDYINSKD